MYVVDVHFERAEPLREEWNSIAGALLAMSRHITANETCTVNVAVEDGPDRQTIATCNNLDGALMILVPLPVSHTSCLALTKTLSEMINRNLFPASRLVEVFGIVAATGAPPDPDLRKTFGPVEGDQEGGKCVH